MNSIAFANFLFYTPYSQIEELIILVINQISLLIFLLFIATMLCMLLFKILKKDEAYKKSKVLFGNVFFHTLSYHLLFSITLIAIRTFHLGHSSLLELFTDNDKIAFSKKFWLIILLVQAIICIAATIIRHIKQKKKLYQE